MHKDVGIAQSKQVTFLFFEMYFSFFCSFPLGQEMTPGISVRANILFLHCCMFSV